MDPTPADPPGPAPYPGTPRWVKLTAAVLVLLLLLVAGLHLAGIGMGPGLHSIPTGH